jgi:ATP-binding protein involved in chromosome partitioning
MLDPRLSVIEDRLRCVNRIIAVSSGKGGVGKSLIAATTALLLSERRLRAGLLDLDFTNPSSSVILGVGAAHPIEDRGMVPPEIHGVKYMSITFFSGEEVMPLRGGDATNAFIEVLALTRWGDLDYLIVDTPPGLGDTLLDLLKIIRKLMFIVVTTPSKLSLETVRKLLALLKGVGAPVIGVIENMLTDTSISLRDEVGKIGARFLGSIPFDLGVERALGSPKKLLETKFAEKLSEMLDQALKIT